MEAEREGGIRVSRDGSSKSHDGKNQSRAENECQGMTMKPNKKEKLEMAAMAHLCQESSC